MGGIKSSVELKRCCQENNHTDLSIGNNKIRSLQDIEKVMSVDNELLAGTYSRKKVCDSTIEHAVKFILSKDNVKTISWGSTDKHISPNETIVLPKLQRIKTRKFLWESYLDYFQKEDNRLKPRLGRTSFYSMCKELTSCDELVLSSVD